MINLIPTPKKCTVIDEKYHSVPLCVHTDVPEWNGIVSAFCDSFEKIFEKSLPISKNAGIIFNFDEDIESNAYVLESKDNIIIRASTAEGASYGAATALQLVNCNNDTATVQSVIIEDKPAKDFRSFMISTGRVFHPFKKMLKYIDLCYFYKVRYMHMHVADDILYSLPSKAFPNLVSEGRHYSFQEVAELNRYAAARGVVLLPEIECPGHAKVLVNAYPEIFANKFENIKGEFYNELGSKIDNGSLICAGSEIAFEGIKTLISEVAEMFPSSPYIHIGGDEATHELWDECPVCKKYMEEHGIADTYDLYSEYVGRVASYVLSIGKTPMVWEGFSSKSAHRVPKETVVIAWESHYQTAPELVANGFKIINATWQPLYIVTSLERRWGPKDILAWNIYNWQHWWEKSEATLNPITLAPTDDMLGATMCAWSMAHEQLISRLLENLPAFSERTWNIKRAYDFNTYRKVIAPIETKAARLICDK